MTINVEDESNKTLPDVDTEGIAGKVIEAALDYEKCPYEAEVNLLLTDDEGIHEMNREHRGIDRPTDVLSFPMFEYDEDGEIIEDYVEFNEMGELCLGDIVISVERAYEQAEEYGHSPEREIGFLTVHSMLHLLGYDHMTEDEEKEMFGYQREILDSIGLTRDTNPEKEDKK